MTNNSSGNFGYIACETEVASCSSLDTSFSFSSDLTSTGFPGGYYKLNLLDLNNFYQVKSLLATADVSCLAPNKYCYKNDSAFNCEAGNYLKHDNMKFTCSATCDTDHNPTYISGLAEDSGFCTAPCNTKNNCIFDFSSFNSSYTCKASYTRLFTTCYSTAAEEFKGALFYSAYFKPPKLAYTLASPLTNYHFELWFYPDRRFLPSNSETNLYAVLTSGLRIRKASLTATNDYQLLDSSNTQIGPNFSLEFSNWYKIAFSVKLSSGIYTYSFHYNKYSSSFKNLTTPNNLQLSSFSFCASCADDGRWFSGFYKWIRVWSGDFLSVDLYKEMDKM